MIKTLWCNLKSNHVQYVHVIRLSINVKHGFKLTSVLPLVAGRNSIISVLLLLLPSHIYCRNARNNHFHDNIGEILEEQSEPFQKLDSMIASLLPAGDGSVEDLADVEADSPEGVSVGNMESVFPGRFVPPWRLQQESPCVNFSNHVRANILSCRPTWGAVDS